MLGRQYPHQVGGLARTLEIVGERWTLLIVRESMNGVRRFDDFHGRLGLSRKSLSARLGLLVEHDLMTKTPYQQRPIRYDYRLTPKGAALEPAIAALSAWGDAYVRAGLGQGRHPESVSLDEQAGHADACIVSGMVETLDSELTFWT